MCSVSVRCERFSLCLAWRSFKTAVLYNTNPCLAQLPYPRSYHILVASSADWIRRYWAGHIWLRWLAMLAFLSCVYLLLYNSLFLSRLSSILLWAPRGSSFSVSTLLLCLPVPRFLYSLLMAMMEKYCFELMGSSFSFSRSRTMDGDEECHYDVVEEISERQWEDTMHGWSCFCLQTRLDACINWLVFGT